MPKPPGKAKSFPDREKFSKTGNYYPIERLWNTNNPFVFNREGIDMRDAIA
jgi:hypothetical protein